MNCVTKRLCTPRTHSHDSTYGFLGTHIFPTNCNKHNESSKLLSNCKIRQKPETVLWKNVVSLSCTPKLPVENYYVITTIWGWVPETWEIMLILARTQKNRSLIAYDTFLRDSWKRCKWNLSWEDFYITLSSGVFFQASQVQRIFRRRRNEGKEKLGARAKKLKKMKFRVVVLWCGAQK